jgi:hypothetical protein
MRQNLVVLTLVFVCSTSLLCRAGLSVNTDAVKRGVVFIFPAKADGEPDQDHPLGTGFLVMAPARGSGTNSGTNLGFLFLVTARHIFNPDWTFCGPDPTSIFVRLNRAAYDADKDDTGVEYIPVTLRAKNSPVYRVSDDDTADAAVILLRSEDFAQSKYDFSPTALAEFATPEEMKQLGPGDAILSAGLLPGVFATKRNYPIFKFGYISNIPDDPFIPLAQGCRHSAKNASGSLR